MRPKIFYFQLNFYVAGNNIPLQVFIKGHFSSLGAARKWKNSFLGIATSHHEKQKPKGSKKPSLEIKSLRWPCPKSVPVFEIPSDRGYSVEEVLGFAHNNKNTN